MYSIVIPTMWKYRPFLDRLNALTNHHLIDEIIIIDNNPTERPSIEDSECEVLYHPKVKLISSGENIFVNPAWNLGVDLAANEYICILNDDVVFDTHVFQKLEPYIIQEDFGCAGAHPGEPHLFQIAPTDYTIDITPWQSPPPGRSEGYLFGFGTLYFVRKSNWVPIPSKLAIYYGDDWVHLTQDTYDRKIYLITNMLYHSPSAQTCSNIMTQEEREEILRVEYEIYKTEVAIFRDAAYQEYIEGEYKAAVSIKSDINEHVPRLRELSSECESVVELGVREGWSTRAFLTQRNKLRSYDIILWPYVSHLFQTMQNIGRDFQYIQASSLEIELDPCDMIFFDTEHTYKQLSQELALHGNKARKYLVFHDTVSYEKELVPAIEEFMKNNIHWTMKEVHYNNNGLTVLERI